MGLLVGNGHYLNPTSLHDISSWIHTESGNEQRASEFVIVLTASDKDSNCSE
jgi:hypothetical protein